MSNTIEQSLVSAPLPPAALRARSLASELAETTNPGIAQRLGFAFVLLFVFVVFARLPEMAAIRFGISLPIVMGISIFAGVAALCAFDLRRLSRMPAVRWLLVFTVWIMVAAVFSSWRGGTLQMFHDYWSKAILICIVTSMLVVTLEDLRKVLYTLAYATLVLIVVGTLWSGTVGGRLTIFGGSAASLSNPNEIASRLLTGFCFCLFLLSSERGFSIKRCLVGLAIPVLLVMALRTGSRTGLLTLFALCAMLALRASLRQFALTLGAAAVSFVVLLVFLPKDVIERYEVMFISQDAEDTQSLTGGQESALLSGEARRELLEEGIGLAVHHPIFGVGPGVYEAAAAEVAKSEGRRAKWHETHNTFVQVAAEDGFPGLVWYGLAILYCLKKTYSLYRKTRNYPQLAILSKMSYCLFMALVCWMMGAAFDSEAYRLEFPLLAALTCAFVLAAEPRILQFQAARFSKVARSAPAAPLLQPAPIATTARRSNPFRFGRMRNP